MMRIVDLILKKRGGESLTREELRFIVEGCADGSLPDYQLAAFLMAVWFQGMSPVETAEFTMAMADSGEYADLSGVEGVKIDKHSTGGVRRQAGSHSGVSHYPEPGRVFSNGQYSWDEPDDADRENRAGR